MAKPKLYEKRKKWGITWVYLHGHWFVREKRDALKCGIFSGVTTSQLNDPKYLRRISSKKSYWDKYI